MPLPDGRGSVDPGARLETGARRKANDE